MAVAEPLADGTPLATEPWPTARQGYYAVFVFALSLVVNFLDRGIVTLLVGPIERDLHLTDLQISYVMGFAFVCFYVFLGLPIARLVDSRSRRAILGWGIAVWSIMTALCGLAQNFGQLFLYRVGVGVGEACTGPSTFSMLADLFPREKLARANAVLQFGIMGGMSAALIVGGTVVTAFSSVPPIEVPLIGTIHGWQLTFFVIGFPGLLVAALMRTVPEPKRRGLVGAGPPVPLKEVFRYLWRDARTFAPLAIGLALNTVTFIGMQSWAPTFFVRTYGWTPAEYGLVAGIVIILVQPAGAMIGSLLAERFARSGRDDANARVGLFSGLLAVPGFIIFPLMPTPWLAIAANAYVLFMFSWAAGPLNAAIQMITPNRMRGRVTALFLIVYNVVGIGVGPTFVALFTDVVFHSPDAIGYSMSLSAAILGPLAVLSIWASLKPYGRSAARARSWN